MQNYLIKLFNEAEQVNNQELKELKIYVRSFIFSIIVVINIDRDKQQQIIIDNGLLLIIELYNNV